MLVRGEGRDTAVQLTGNTPDRSQSCKGLFSSHHGLKS